MRKFISLTLGILFVFGAVLLAKYFIDNKKKPRPRFGKVIKTVFVDEVINRDIPIVISSNGNLTAKNKVAIYSEVQGVLEISGKEFKAGTSYAKGQTLLRLNSDEFRANLQSQRSNLFNKLTAVMPDIQLDYPEEYDKWKAYLSAFDIEKSVEKLPEMNSEKEKFFISGRGVMSSYYAVKNLEVKYEKYAIKAPFNGILTEALVNPGTLVRPGQKLGELIDPSIYELGVSIKSAYKDLLEVGNKVALFNLEKTKTWTGKVVRVNGKVDQNTQTVMAFIEVRADDLKEGQYLEVNLTARSEKNAFEIPRNLLVNNTKLFIVNDSVLNLIDVNTVYEGKNTVIIKGLANGTKILAKQVSGAHNGMSVEIANEK